MLASPARAEEPFRANLNVRLKCPECGIDPPDIVERFSEGDMVCGDCGLVLGDRIVDTRSEWRTFANDDQGNDDPSRVGDAGSPLLEGSQLDTVIASGSGIGSGGFGGSKGYQLGRDLSRLQARSSHDRKETVLHCAFSRIGQMCEAYLLPKIVQEAAKETYKLVYDDRKLKGKSQEAIMASAIFIACRHSGVARTFMEICALTGVPKKEIGKTFKTMVSILTSAGVKKSTVRNNEYRTAQTSAEDFMRRFCSLLGLSSKVTKAAEYIAVRAKEEGTLAGRSPISLAAAAIYMASALFSEPTSAVKIADKTGVSDGTIKTSYKLLHAAKDKVIDPQWLSSGQGDISRIPRV